MIGRTDHAFQDFVEAHAKITSAVGSDPLSGKKLPYVLEKVDGGFRTVVKFKSRGEDRATEVNGETVQELQPDETLGRYLFFDRRGRTTRDVLVGLQFPDDGQSLFERLRSVYLEGAESPAGVMSYSRRDGREYLNEDAKLSLAKSGRVPPGSPAMIAPSDSGQSYLLLWWPTFALLSGARAWRILKKRS